MMMVLGVGLWVGGGWKRTRLQSVGRVVGGGFGTRSVKGYPLVKYECY